MDERTVLAMIRLKVKRFDNIELHESAFAPPTAPPAEQPEKIESDNQQCPCGHSLVIEHNSAGCYHGCDAETCAPHPDAEQKP